jgi:RNA polymerase sigma factor (sigma-70 family)
MSPPPTADLAERTLELARIYRAQRALVRQQLRGFGVRDAALEDALHDVFVIAFRKLASYETQRGSLPAWLVGIAWRVAAAHRRQREAGVQLHDDEVASDLPDPESYAARSEAAGVLDRLLRSLPPEQAAAFVLAELEGLSGAEIAEQWHIAPATAYTRVARARLKMQAELERSRYGRRPWWAVLFWPGETNGTAIAAAFVSMRVLAGIVAAILVLGGALWWLSNPTNTAAVVADAKVTDTDARKHDRVAASRDDDDAFGPRGKAASIAGRVHAISGAAIKGAEVCAWPEVAEHGTPTPTCTTSAPTGSYRIAGILPSRYRITASARGFAPGEAAATTARGTSSIALHAGEDRKGIDIALAEGGVELRGLVNDVFGGVVDGARITITQYSVFTRFEGPSSGPGVPVHATTAADGTFVAWVGQGDLEVTARAEGYGHALVRVRAPGPTVTISLLPESTLSGIVVVRETRAPIAGARVVLRSWSETSAQEETATFTDDEGRFEIRGLVPGRYRPVAYADGLHGESARSHVLDLGDSVDDIVVEMIAAATLHAKVVVAPDDTPCPSGSVMLWDHRAEIVRTAVIAPGGIVTFPALTPGEYGIVVGCDDHDSSKVPTQVVVADTGPTEVTWTVERGLAIRGRVLDARGRPIVGQVMATAASTGPDGAPHWASIATDGSYVLSGLAPGDYSLMVASDGPDLEASTTIVDRDVVVDFDAPATVRIAGKVMRGAAPAAGVSVLITPGEAWLVETTVAADDGAFVFEALEPGRYRVHGKDDLGNVSAEQIVVLTADREPAALAIAMPEPRSIRGVVLDEDGGPLRDALVSARATSSMTTEASRRAELRAAKAGGPGTTLSDAHGEFVLTGVAAGETYTVVAQRRGGGSATQEGVSAGDHARLQLAATATIRGTVRAASGPSALWVELYADGGLVQRESFVTGSGAFEIEDVDPGEYELRVISREGRGKVRVVAKAGETSRVELELIGNRTIRGRFVDLDDGTPLPGLWALVTEQGVSPQRIAIAAERAIQTRTPGLLTGADGVFTAHDVPPTAVTLLALTAGFQYEAQDHVMEAILVPESHREDEIVDFAIAKPRLSWAAPPADLGFEMTQIPLACTETLRVAKIVDATIAAGLALGDEIVTVDGHDVTERRCYLVRALLRVPPETTVELGLARGETVRVTARASK